MLEKFICVDNVGVFRKGVQTAFPLKKLVLIYGDNARGKSTLSSGGLIRVAQLGRLAVLGARAGQDMFVRSDACPNETGKAVLS